MSKINVGLRNTILTERTARSVVPREGKKTMNKKTQVSGLHCYESVQANTLSLSSTAWDQIKNN
jgi:hypothetical protein